MIKWIKTLRHLVKELTVDRKEEEEKNGDGHFGIVLDRIIFERKPGRQNVLTKLFEVS